MKKIFYLIISLIIVALSGCNDEWEMLVTDRTDCYMSRFQVRGTDNITILADVTIGRGIDTTALTVNATVKYGTDLKRLKPNCSLSPESVMEPANGAPAMGTWVDFTKGPYSYTVISGSRQVRKTYTITVTAQQ